MTATPFAITTRSEDGRGRSRRSGAECWVGTPDRLATLRGALDGVTSPAGCWGRRRGLPSSSAELHGTRLEFFLTQAIDTTVRGILYEAAGARSYPSRRSPAGEQLARRMTELNQIPLACLAVDPADTDAWVACGAAVRSTHCWASERIAPTAAKRCRRGQASGARADE